LSRFQRINPHLFKSLLMYKLFLLFLFAHFFCSAQDNYIIHLNNVSIEAASENDFKICYVIDGRKNKKNIGWVQTGLANKTRIANFEKPFDREITHLLDRSELLSSDTTAWIILVSRLHISESPKGASEMARAEVALDFFKPFGGDSCYFFGSTFGSFEQLGMDVTKKHAENISRAFEKAIDSFKRRRSHPSVEKKPYLLADLLSENFTVRNLSSIAILNASRYADGIFETFNDFLLNKATFNAEYDASIGKSISLWRIDANRKKRIREGVVAFAKDNQLYYLFHENFYPLEKKRGTFQFIGPGVFHRNKTGHPRLGGFLGGALTASTSARRRIYQLDLENGRLIEIGSIK
jgi:hypothetical protein